MKREELKEILGEVGDDVLKKILDINSLDIGRAKKEKEEENIKLKELLAAAQKREEEEAKKREDEAFMNKILQFCGEREFSCEYAKEGIAAEMKKELEKSENTQKSHEEIFEELAAKKEGIFKNPNPPQEIAGMGSGALDLGKDEFSKMGYKAKAELYNKNKELYELLKEE